MSLVNFTDPSLEQLRGILGSYGNEQVGRLIKSTSTYVESRWFVVTEEIENTTPNPDGSTNDEKEYKASEVMMDGTVVPNGIWFDSDATESNDPDNPIYFSNLKFNGELFTGAVEVGKAYQVEFITPKTYEEETTYYIIPKGGGGGGASFYRLIVKSDFTLVLDGTSNQVDLIDDQNQVITSNVIVRQRKFNTANFYENEILYGVDYSVEGSYLLDPFLAGIGGTSA